MKKLSFIFVVLCILVCFVSCSLFSGFDAKGLIQGNLDSVFLNKHSDEYLNMVNLTKEEAQAEYQSGLQIEAQYFASYWGIVEEEFGETYEELDEELKNNIVALLDKIYSYTKYEIGEVTSSSEQYTVEVIVYPIDIYEKALNEIEDYAPYISFWNKYADIDISSLSDAEYAAYTTEYGNIIVDLVKTQLSNVGYKDAKSFAIRIDLIDDMWSINQEDFNTFDSHVIYYG